MEDKIILLKAASMSNGPLAGEMMIDGWFEKLAEKIESMVRASEWKRSQGAIGTKTTTIAFGSGRRVPITTRFTAL